MNAEIGNGFSIRKPNEALYKVVVDDEKMRRRSLPQVHYGFDHETYRREAREVWDGLPRRGPLPPAGALKSMVVPLFRVHSILFEFSLVSNDVAIPFVGLEVARMSRLDMRPRSVADAPHDSVLARLPSFFAQVVETLAPVEFTSLAAVGPKGGATFSGILLPFQEVDGHVSHIYVILDQNGVDVTDDDVFDLSEEYLAERFETNEALQADLNVLELKLDQVLAELADRDLESSLTATSDQTPLAAALGEARSLAQEASTFDGRSRTALYDALAKALAVARHADDAPEEYLELLQIGDIRVQARAPMTPVAKLVFGKTFDRTRLTEYATVLAFGTEEAIAPEKFASFLAEYPGGIKGIVAEQRKRRKGDAAVRAPRQTVRPRIAQKLRALPTRPVDSLSHEGGEFGVMLFRRMDDGSVAMLSEISDDAAAVEAIGSRILKRAEA